MTACDNPQQDGNDGDSAQGDSELRIGLAYDVGGKGDKSFNDSAFRGLERVKDELGITDGKDFEPKEGEADSDKEERLKLMANEGYDVIISVGFAYAEPLKKVAPQFPDVDFAIIDSRIEDHDNVTSLVFAEEQASFLAGAAAALKSEEDHIGFVGGVKTPLIQKFQAGYEAGAKEITDDIDIEVSYLTQPPDFGGFSDPARGESTAKGQFDKGADVVFHAAGASGNGVLQAAADKEKLFIGVDSDQYESAADDQKQYVVTSALKNIDTAVFDYVKSVQDGKTQSGVQEFDLSDGGVDYATSNREQISDIQDQLDELKQKIIDGDIEVPTKP
ncbi:BMP family ABC transporter substrate-binding protein [Nocardiopsis gilva YIM 90087]|uniref:BMP family ABC transporter substrate-binding protein n=2 Tax=Nocardiopsis gilva TaxID=280236 RepID=A0A223SE01_9ACTN|nr:BMP family ABC transporter substrate-binding protein [Nocardiopsis gilva YIM 90087]